MTLIKDTIIKQSVTEADLVDKVAMAREDMLQDVRILSQIVNSFVNMKFLEDLNRLRKALVTNDPKLNDVIGDTFYSCNVTQTKINNFNRIKHSFANSSQRYEELLKKPQQE